MRLEINKKNLIKLNSDFKIESLSLGRIINPILDNYDLEEKEILEVCQIGKFVHKVNSKIQIVQKPQPPDPDFIIAYEEKLIGLEHTRIATKNAKRYYSVKTIIDYSEKIFNLKYPNNNVLATISILNDELNYKQNEKDELAELIADLVYSVKSKNKVELPSFVTGIRTTEHSLVSFDFDEKDWQSEYLTKERLKQEIEKKERKIKGYEKSKIKLSELWLVLLIGSLNSASYRLNNNENYETDSKFDRVYLMADFKAKVIRIK
jgi:hypothetical protein